MKVDLSKVKECIENWDTIICSISTAKRNGKVINRITRVKNENYEKCIKSFCDHHKEKLTNYRMGELILRYIENEKQGEHPYIKVVEYIPDSLYFGEFKQFAPTLVEDTWVYDLVEVNL